jgi:Putative zinc-finger
MAVSRSSWPRGAGPDRVVGAEQVAHEVLHALAGGAKQVGPPHGEHPRPVRWVARVLAGEPQPPGAQFTDDVLRHGPAGPCGLVGQARLHRLRSRPERDSGRVSLGLPGPGERLSWAVGEGRGRGSLPAGAGRRSGCNDPLTRTRNQARNGSPPHIVVRQALGAYLLGALSPSERAAVDAHLAWCAGCRAELVGLAGLPGLLGSVSTADAAGLAAPGAGPETPEEPVPPMPLQPVLDQAVRLRRHLMWRRVAAAAAVTVIAAGGAAAATHALAAPAGPPVAVMHWAGTLHGHNPASGAAAIVQYLPRPWGLQLQVQVRDIPAGTRCALQVSTAGGQLVTRAAGPSPPAMPGCGIRPPRPSPSQPSGDSPSPPRAPRWSGFRARDARPVPPRMS